MDLNVDPPQAVGPIEIGMAFDAAERILRGIPGFVSPSPDERVNPGFAHYESEMSISLAADRSGRIKAVEIYRPEHGVRVMFQGISLLGDPAVEVISRLQGLTRIEAEDEGLRVLVSRDSVYVIWVGILFVVVGWLILGGWS